jgi:hypothetical protein
MLINTVKIKAYEKGLLFADDEFKSILGSGRHWFTRMITKNRVDVVSMRDPWLCHEDLDVIIASGALGDNAKVLDLSDKQRGLVWIDKRFAKVLGPGQYVLWDTCKEIKVEVIDVDMAHFVHDQLETILESELADKEFHSTLIDQGNVGILYIGGVLQETLKPGLHAFWKRMGKVKIIHVDLRESILDIGGQEIMTADKVSLRLNGLCTFRVKDPILAVSTVDDYKQALYREAQLALRAIVGTAELDGLLGDKDALASQIQQAITLRVADFGLEMIGFGIRDIILPGEMKNLLNKVVESKKAAEANLITRREETAAMRSQANTAKMLEGNKTLMRLKELEVLEKIATSSNLNVICGDGGISDKVLKLI